MSGFDNEPDLGSFPLKIWELCSYLGFGGLNVYAEKQKIFLKFLCK